MRNFNYKVFAGNQRLYSIFVILSGGLFLSGCTGSDTVSTPVSVYTAASSVPTATVKTYFIKHVFCLEYGNFIADFDARATSNHSKDYWLTHSLEAERDCLSHSFGSDPKAMAMKLCEKDNWRDLFMRSEHKGLFLTSCLEKVEELFFDIDVS